MWNVFIMTVYLRHQEKALAVYMMNKNIYVYFKQRMALNLNIVFSGAKFSLYAVRTVS